MVHAVCGFTNSEGGKNGILKHLCEHKKFSKISLLLQPPALFQRVSLGGWAGKMLRRLQQMEKWAKIIMQNFTCSH